MLGCLPIGILRDLFHNPGARIRDLIFLIPPIIAAIAWRMTLQPRGDLRQIAGFEVLGTDIHTRLSDLPIDLNGAALGSVILMALVLAAVFVQTWVTTRRSSVVQTGKPTKLDEARIGSGRCRFSCWWPMPRSCCPVRSAMRWPARARLGVRTPNREGIRQGRLRIRRAAA